ncbi:MAG TPA: hypothetical protein VE476_09820 [Propionibacteriaceae bacterium]|nr:hypothetical protein [Propionibacteriaceae bacterium]
MDRVVIGMDPHKRSVTIEARDTREVLRATGTFGSDTGSHRGMLRLARQWPQRVWAVEGAHGVGRPVAQRLLADGERVLDKLAARARVFDAGRGARPTPTTRTRWSWSRCGTGGCARLASTPTGRCCGCCVIAGMRCPGPTSRAWAGPIGSSPSCCPAGHRWPTTHTSDCSALSACVTRSDAPGGG